MSILQGNDLLKTVEAKIESQLQPDTKANSDKIVNAGMKLALAKGPDGILASLKNSKDPVSDVVHVAIGIVGMLRREAHGAMPPKAMVPAAFVLMLHGLDFAQKLGV